MLSIVLICLGLLADDGVKPALRRPSADRAAYEAAAKEAARCRGQRPAGAVVRAARDDRRADEAPRRRRPPGPLQHPGPRPDGHARLPWQVGAPRRRHSAGRGRSQTSGADGGVPPAPRQGPRQGGRPGETGRLVRPERPEEPSHRPLPRPPPAGPEARRGVEAPGVQEGQRELDQARVAGGGEAGGRRASPGQQALEAAAGAGGGRP